MNNNKRNTNETACFKRFYTRGALTSIRIPGLAKIPYLYRDWLRGYYLSCIEGKGVGKEIHCYSAQNAALFVDLL